MDQANSNFQPTCLKGYVTTTFADLVKTFGAPTYPTGDDYKTDAEWRLKTDQGIITIYNYKDGKNYNGKEGLATKKITDWHVGGEGNDNTDTLLVVDFVKAQLGLI